MECNGGLRSVAKISLNNMGGEAGESTQQDPNQRFHRTPQADRVLDSNKIDVRSINVVTDNVVEVYFKKTEEDDLATVYMNTFLACLTTCWGRLHLKPWSYYKNDVFILTRTRWCL